MMRTLPAVLALLLLPLALPADNEAYGGLGVGYTTFQVDAADIVGRPGLPGFEGSQAVSEFEGADLAARAFLGVRLGPYVALEAGYHDFGEPDGRVAFIDPENPPTGPFDAPPSSRVAIGATGYDAVLIGILPLDRDLSVYAKAGLIRWDAETTYDGGTRTREDGEDLIWGVGTTYRGTGPLRIRIEAEFIDAGFANSWWALSASLLYAVPFGG